MKLLFFASHRFAIESLELLLASRHEVIAVVGRPDMPSGRGLDPAPTPAVEEALARGLKLMQPENLSRECFSAFVEALEWDAGIVVAYGGLIPQWLLETPRFGFINLHPSLLPRYRGAAPIQRAIMNGASITGVTTIRMNEVLDAGDILMHSEARIGEDDRTGTLRDRLARIGSRVLLATIDNVEDGNVTPVAQEEDKATYAAPVLPSEVRIDWNSSAEAIDRLVRAMDPAPGAFSYFRGRRVKIWDAHVTDVPPEDEPGTIINLGKEGFMVNTGTTGLQPVKLQPEGKNRMSAAEFSRGQRLLPSERFTSDPRA
ncbi:MAG: methionyl-tRNA formyltransferase [Candidatus Anoxymicrobium japonicum]|uniref:Methionyl-tRNA formyltransferase n=1 Tax=Candidatus Anoxymicrobium japonicum TaxID=2013648 RepID=A0A2N3G678_9ACTN|nr:MAG: methionyl-tRNA formyltransferase [Candidatus Anoxymicrobium japonicum]